MYTLVLCALALQSACQMHELQAEKGATHCRSVSNDRGCSSTWLTLMSHCLTVAGLSADLRACTGRRHEIGLIMFVHADTALMVPSTLHQDCILMTCNCKRKCCTYVRAEQCML